MLGHVDVTKMVSKLTCAENTERGIRTAMKKFQVWIGCVHSFFYLCLILIWPWSPFLLPFGGYKEFFFPLSHVCSLKIPERLWDRPLPIYRKMKFLSIWILTNLQTFHFPIFFVKSWYWTSLKQSQAFDRRRVFFNEDKLWGNWRNLKLATMFNSTQPL